MVVFSSLEAAQREGFKWYAFNVDYKLHVVELDRRSRRVINQREKLMAFAHPSPQDHEILGNLN
ncbi:MAG: hypothetical protein ACYCW6_02905 [Candidatus Xenobia bacterium]